MKEVKVKSPGTGGEYIQGWYQGSPCLISCPIDCYSIISVTEGDFRKNRLKAKSQKMVAQFIEKNYLSPTEYKKINIRVESEIPEGKGMASSTADLAGIAVALSAYFDLGLTDRQIAKLCSNIEPSDNLMFPQLNLFDHLSGQVIKEIGGTIEAKILIIDFQGRIDTLSFNESQDDYSKEELGEFAKIISLFEEGVRDRDLGKIGQACTLSACLNQKRLYKRQLEPLIKLMEDNRGEGIVVGHSGTVVGVIYEEEKFMKENFLSMIKPKISKKDYIYDKHLIKGGIEIISP